VTGLNGGLGVAGVSSDRSRFVSAAAAAAAAAAASCSVSPSASDVSDCAELGAFDKTESCARNDIQLPLLLLPSSPGMNSSCRDLAAISPQESTQLKFTCWRTHHKA